MGNFVMSLALVVMFTGTAFLFAAPVLIQSDFNVPLINANLCLQNGIGCGR